jgi:hypothetical protein
MKMCTDHKITTVAPDNLIYRQYYYTITCDECDVHIRNGRANNREYSLINNNGDLSERCKTE